jgi:hypothetical protein
MIRNSRIGFTNTCLIKDRYQLNNFICIKDFNAETNTSLKLNLFSFFICGCQHHQRKTICLYVYIPDIREIVGNQSNSRVVNDGCCYLRLLWFGCLFVFRFATLTSRRTVVVMIVLQYVVSKLLVCIFFFSTLLL